MITGRVIIPGVITSSSFHIEYYIPWEEDISLEIYDSVGRRVDVLFRGRRNEGRYRVASKRGLPSGIYFVRLRYGKKSVVKKVVMIR